MRWLISGSIGLLVCFSGGMPSCFADSDVQPVPTQPTQLNPQTPPQRSPSPGQQSPQQPTQLKQSPAKPSVITVRSMEELRLKLDRVPDANEGRLTVFLDQVDVTSQVVITGRELVYRSRFLSLTPGEHTLTVYVVKSVEQWTVLAIFALKVDSTPSATVNSPPQLTVDKPDLPANSISERPQTPEIAPASPKPSNPPSTQANDLKLTPRLNVNFKSQLAEARTPDAGISKRPTFTDLTFTGGLTGQYQKDNLNIQASFNLAGSTFKPEALRFNELKEAAPQVDLSDYLLDVTWGPAQFSLGHLCYGNHPFLVNNLCSRGLTSKIKLGDRVDLSIAHLSSTSLVGFDNILGVERQDNTITAATLGIQLLNNQAGGVRLETTWMSGSRQPLANFNVGEVVDAEESQGFGVRLTAADSSNRLKLDAGFVRSRFTNPTNDPQLLGNLDVVEVKPVTRNAWYVESSYDLLREVKLDATRTLGLSFNFRHERIDPQFGTVGTSVTADQLRTQFGVNATIAGATIQFQANQSEDNLTNIPTILKTRTRSILLNINAPLQTVLNVNSNFLPTLTYSFQRTHQLGVNQPIEALSGFDASEIPDQLTTNHQFGATWLFTNLSLSYQYSNTFQDNRQITRENTDFRTLNHQLSLAWQATPRFNVTLGYNFTSAQAFEQGITRFTSSPTLGISWLMFPNLTLAFNYNRTADTDSLNEKTTQGTNLEVLLTWQFKLHGFGQEIPASAFLRYGRQATITRDRTFALDTDATIQTINAGISFSF